MSFLHGSRVSRAVAWAAVFIALHATAAGRLAAADAQLPSPEERAAELYRRAFERYGAGDLAGAAKATEQLLAYKVPVPCFQAKGHALRGDIGLRGKAFTRAAQDYEKALEYARQAASNQLPDDEQARWRLTAKVLRAHPDGLYQAKSLDDPTVLQAAFREMAAEAANAIEGVIVAAAEQPGVSGARILDKCDPLMAELRILDGAKADSMTRRVAQARENALARAAESYLSEMDALRSKILLNHPQRVYWTYYHGYVWPWRPGPQYSNEAAFQIAKAYWAIFNTHNANVTNLDREAAKAETCIRQIQALHQSTRTVSWVHDPAALLTRVRQLQRYPAPPAPPPPPPALPQVPGQPQGGYVTAPVAQPQLIDPQYSAWVVGQRMVTLPLPPRPKLVKSESKRSPTIRVQPGIMRRAH
ncbi:MAG TPA: hypothetical protein VM238_09825 [Phycisphaerae bacterium]|nr:hypothetical protein [Phycisphaerae bacterium]